MEIMLWGVRLPKFSCSGMDFWTFRDFSLIIFCRLSTGRHSAFTAVFHLIFVHLIPYGHFREHRRSPMKALSAVSIHRQARHQSPFSFTSMVDLMWSDPDDIDNWAVSPRGAGWLFGGSVVKEVCSLPSPFLPRLTFS